MLGHARLLLAFGVLLAHGKLLPEDTSRSMVSAFFVVSGYLMMLTLSSNYGRAVLPFYWNRILRLYPLHITVCVVVAILFPSFVSERFTEYARLFGDKGVVLTVAMSLLLLPRYAGFFNKPAWTLPFELVFYILAPLLYRLGPLGVAAYAGIGIAGFALLAPAAEIIQPFGLNWTASGTAEGFLASMLYFGLGAMTFFLQPASFRKSMPATRRAITVAGLIILSGTLILTLRFWHGSVAFLYAGHGTLINIAAVTSVLLVLAAWDGRESPASKLAGDLCYPVYMLHFMFTDYLVDVHRYRSALVRIAELSGFPDLEFILRSLVAATGSLVLGYAWVRFERRTLRRMRSTRPQAEGQQANPAWAQVAARSGVK